MKKIVIAIFTLFTTTNNLKSQITEVNFDIAFQDTLSLNPLSDWIKIENEETNIWEIGIPSKTYFDSSFTYNKAIITDSTNFYSNNLNDCIYITLPNTGFWEAGMISFYHKFDTDTLTDGGIIDISYDNGTSWINIKEDIYHVQTNFIGLYEDTIQGGEFGFSGKSNGWQYVELYWLWHVAVKNSQLEYYPILRFTFISDNINTNKDGWMIDHIVYRAYDALGSNANEIQNEEIKVYPIPLEDKLYFDLNFTSSTEFYIFIYNSKGKLMLNKQIQNNQVHLSELNKGIYFYSIQDKNRLISTGKLIKN